MATVAPPESAWVVKPIVLMAPPVALASKPDTKFIDAGACRSGHSCH